MAEPIVTRAEAKAQGLKRYFTGKPCKNSHVALRVVANGQCVVCAYEAEKKYKAGNREKFRDKWRRTERARNADPSRREARVAARNKWIAENREANDERINRWKAANPEKVKKYGRHWRERNIDLKRDKVRKWRDANRNREEYKKQAIDRVNRWIKENPELKRELSRKGSHTRRARQYQAGGSYTNAEIRALLEQQSWLCAEVTCRAALRDGKELDHIVPISKGGANHIGNLQWLCPPCNRQKRDMMPDEWAQSRAKLKESRS